MKTRFLHRTLALLLALALACPLLTLPAAAEESGAEPAEPEPTEPAAPKVSVKITPAGPITFYVGDDPITLTATVESEDSDAVSRGVTWNRSPSASEYVNISTTNSTLRISTNPNANIEDMKAVTITVTATARATSMTDSGPEHPSATCLVSILPPTIPKVSSVEIVRPVSRYVDPDTNAASGKLELTAVVVPEEISENDRKVTWSCSPDTIAKVNPSTGVVTGVAPGKAYVTASAGGKKSEPLEIETSGILLSYIKKSATGGTGTTVSLTKDSVVDIPQNQSIFVTPEPFGNAKGHTVSWESKNNSVAQANSGQVAAFYPGETEIVATVDGTGFTATFKVRVFEDVADAITVNMGSSASYSFSGIMSQLNRRSQDKAGAPLESVTNLKVSTENGVLYYGYTSPSSPGHGVGGAERFYYQPAAQTQLSLRDVTFVPLTGFGGTAVVDYNATATNGTTFNGSIRIEATTSGDVSYSTELDQPVSFAAEHFSAICMSRTGQSVRYVNFSQPAASRGTLYYNYSPTGQYSPKVDSSTAYYISSNPSIDNITFVPAEGFTGSVDIAYRCVNSSGASYTGAVTVTVSSLGGSAATGDVEYSIARNQRQSLRVSDFNSACRSIIGGTLDYIRFTDLPSSSAGILYLNYTSSSSTRVAPNRNYYRSYSPYISNISFVPAANYSGTVVIPFTAANTSGDTFSGTLVIHVGDGVTTVRYSTSQNRAVTFEAADFNDVSRWFNGAALHRVRFTSLPSSSAGTLYYNYVSANSTGSRVSTGTSYYRSGSPSLSNITFVPASGYAGTITFRYVGYSDGGETFSGTVEIRVSGSDTVGTGTGVASSIRYTGSSTPISFRSSDFQSICQTALGNPLSYVQFSSLPAVGRLNQNYSGPAQTGAGVNTASRYGTQDLDQISYLPKAEYQGTVYIPYTLYDTQGRSQSGSVEIQLSNGYASSSFSDTVSGWDWAKPSIEFLRYSGITTGYSDGTYRPGRSISRGEFTLMVCRAFQFPTTGSSGFPDVPAGSAYAGAVASARDLGIVQGNNGLFQPNLPITRQSAMTMIYRAMQAAGQPLPAVDAGILSSYVDGGQVSSFARSSVAALIQMGAVQGNDARLNPTAAISRAQMAVILHRVLAR